MQSLETLAHILLCSAAVKEIDPKWVPKITYVICGKRYVVDYLCLVTRTDWQVSIYVQPQHALLRGECSNAR